MPDKALDGVKVLDLTHHIAGPYCTKLLADFGADVVKIERPGSGDPARRMGPFFNDEPHVEKSLPFLYLNTNKRSVTLDLKTHSGRHILKRLVDDVDVVVENFSPRVLQSFGLAYEDLRKLNPQMVMVSISNFGQTGPYRDYRATDIVEYALGGLMYIFGSEDREPLKHALHQTQFKAGTNAATAATIALYHQQIAGIGQHVDVSIQESVASALRDTTSLYTYMGAIRKRQVPHISEMYGAPAKVQDGYIIPTAYGRGNWAPAVDFLDATELREPRFATPGGRLENAGELDEIFGGLLRQRDKFDLFYDSHRHRGLIYGVIQDPAEVVENPQYKSREYFTDIEHPISGVTTYPGAPFMMSETPWDVGSPAPTLGQHNQDILCDGLGYSLNELTQLRASGVI